VDLTSIRLRSCTPCMKDRASPRGTSLERLGMGCLVRYRVPTRNAEQSALACSCAMTQLRSPFSVMRGRKHALSRMPSAFFCSPSRNHHRTHSCHLFRLRDLLHLVTSTGCRWLALACKCHSVCSLLRVHCVTSFARALCNVFSMCGLEFYSPGKGWRQAHMQGRWAILRLMIECGAVDIIVRARIGCH
jgi:hypothetical protein